MALRIWEKPPYAVIGIEGSTNDGADFVKKLWDTANARYPEVEALALKHPSGAPLAIWGAMSDFSRTYKPWEMGFSQGLYIAGVECALDARPPEGWTKWTLPGFTFAMYPAGGPDAFLNGLEAIKAEGYTLAYAAQDYTCPSTGESFICYPIARA